MTDERVGRVVREAAVRLEVYLHRLDRQVREDRIGTERAHSVPGIHHDLDWRDPWLDEALTTYSSLLFWEVSEGPYVFRQVLQFYQDRYDELVEAGYDDIVTNDLAYFEGLDDPGIYGDVVYIKGALFFQAVREKIGDKAFFEAFEKLFWDIPLSNCQS